MRDPLLMESTDTFQYYEAKPIRKDWEHPTLPQLVESVNKLHTFTRQLVKEKEGIQRQLRAARCKYYIWVLGVVIAGEGLVLGWLVPTLLRIKMGGHP